mgnify:CR=1 FL=1
MTVPALEVRNISLSFKGVKAISDLSFRVEQGEICALIGPNGAGKSSLLNILNGVYTPDAGEIVFEGRHFDRMRPGDAAMKAENVATVSEKSLVHLGIAGSHLYLFTEAPSVLRATKITTAGAPAGSVGYRVVPVPLMTQSMVIDPRTNTL